MSVSAPFLRINATAMLERIAENLPRLAAIFGFSKRISNS
jgi:hypothetical protein